MVRGKAQDKTGAQYLTDTDTHTYVMKHSFPLRPDLYVVLEFPVDLTPQDVERLTKFMHSLAFENNKDGADG